jgi:hypothetical protein
MVDSSTIGCWAKRAMASETEKEELHDLPYSGHPVTAVGPEMLQHADTIVCKDQRITTRQLVLSLSISKGSVSHIIQDFGYSKVCVRCVPPSITVKHKTERKAIPSELLACIETEGATFLSRIVTADETWVHDFELETKGNLWNGTILDLSAPPPPQ